MNNLVDYANLRPLTPEEWEEIVAASHAERDVWAVLKEASETKDAGVDLPSWAQRLSPGEQTMIRDLASDPSLTSFIDDFNRMMEQNEDVWAKRLGFVESSIEAYWEGRAKANGSGS